MSKSKDHNVINVRVNSAEKQQMLEAIIAEIVSSKKKTWVAGEDWVQYSGSFLDEKEYIAIIRTLLDGWFALGENGIRFEYKFPERLGKGHGCLSNSGSSANLLMLS